MFTRILILKWEVLTIGLIAAVGISACQARGPLRIPSFRSAAPFLFLGACIVVSVLAAHNRHDAVKHAFRLGALVSLYAVISRSGITTPRIWRLIRMLALSGTAVGLLALGIGMVTVLRGGSNFHTMFPTFRNANFAAQFLAPIVPLSLALAINSNKTRGRILWAAASLVIAGALAATGARGGYLGACAGSLALAAHTASSRGWLKKRNIRIGVTVAAAVIVLAAGIFAAAFVPRMLESKQEMLRPQLWICATRMFASQPLTGVGPGNFQVRFGDFGGYKGRWAPNPDFRIRYAHNDYLQVLAEYGLLGLCALGWLILKSVLALRRSNRTLAGGAVLGAVTGTLAHSLVSFPLCMPASSLCFWTSLGIAGALGERPEGETAGAELTLPPRPVWVTLCALCTLAAAAMPFRFLMSDLHLARSSAAVREARTAQDEGKGKVARYYLSRANGSVESSLRYDTNNRPAWFQKGVVSTMDRRYEDAARAYEQAIALLPGYHVQHYNLGQAHLKKGDDQAALAEFKKAVDIHPGYAAAHIVLALSYRRSGDKRRAAQEYEKAGTLDPKLKKLLIMAANLYDELGMKADAERCRRPQEDTGLPPSPRIPSGT